MILHNFYKIYIIDTYHIFCLEKKKTNSEIDLLLFCYIHVLFELSIFQHMPNWCTSLWKPLTFSKFIWLAKKLLHISTFNLIWSHFQEYMAMAAPNLLYFYVTSKFLPDRIIYFIDGRSPSKTYQNRFYSFISVFSRTTISWRGNATQGNIYDPD